MGLKEVRDNAFLAKRLYQYIQANKELYPSINETVEVLDILEKPLGWRVTLGLGNQGESSIDAHVALADFARWQHSNPE